MLAMRGHGDGTKTQRGYWRVTLQVTDELGRKQTKYFERKTLIEAQRARLEWLTKNGRTITLPETGTLSELIDAVDGHLWKTMTSGLRRNMMIYAELWKKALGDQIVSELTAPILTRTHIAQCTGKSRSYITKHRDVIRRTLAYAVSDLGWITSNPAENIRSPRATDTSKGYEPMTRKEFEKMIALAPSDTRIVIRLCGECGMRPSEAIRVRPEHLVSVSDRWLVQILKSKTAAGIRHVPVSDELAREIERINPDAWNGISDPLDNIRKWWRKNSDTRLYDLRGWCADEWRRRGIPDQVRSWLLGHTEVKFTQTVYETLTSEDTLKLF